MRLARWNKGQCRCECKKLIDKGICDKGFIFNPSNCKCECDKSCNASQYSDYLNFKYKKKIIDSLIEECAKNIDETKLVDVAITKNNNETKLVNITITKNNNETKLVSITITGNNNNNTKLVNITITKNENSDCNSCKVYIVLTIVAIVISTVYSIYFVYYNWFLIKNKDFSTKYNTHKKTIIW